MAEGDRLDGGANCPKCHQPTKFGPCGCPPTSVEGGEGHDVDREKETELLEDIIKNSGVLVFGHIEKAGELMTGYQSKGSQPINETFEFKDDDESTVLRKKLNFGLSNIFGVQGYPVTLHDINRALDLDGDRRLDGAIGFQQMERPLYTIQPEQIKNRNRSIMDILSGTNKTITTHRRIHTGYEPVNHSEVIQNGKQEPAYRVGIVTMGIGGDGRGCDYTMCAYLPKSIALRLWKKIDANPRFIAQVVDEFLKRSLQLQHVAGKTNLGQGHKIYVVRPHRISTDGNSPDPTLIREIQ